MFLQLEHSVSVTNADGCSGSDSVLVEVNSLNIASSSTNVSCYGLSDGSAIVSAVGEVPLIHTHG